VDQVRAVGCGSLASRVGCSLVEEDFAVGSQYHTREKLEIDECLLAMEVQQNRPVTEWFGIRGVESQIDHCAACIRVAGYSLHSRAWILRNFDKSATYVSKGMVHHCVCKGTGRSSPHFIRRFRQADERSEPSARPSLLAFTYSSNRFLCVSLRQFFVVR